MTRKEGDIGLLDAIPERLIKWERDGEGKLVVLLVPRFRRGPLKRWLQPRLKRPHMRVTLDEIGTAVWENCDGKKTVREISDILKERFGEKIEPLEPRMKVFFTQLFKSQFVRYWCVADKS